MMEFECHTDPREIIRNSLAPSEIFLKLIYNFVTFEETEKTLVYINSLGMNIESFKK